MKLVQFWRDGAAALGIQTPQGVVDVQREAARRGIKAPENMMEAIALGEAGLALLADLAREAARCPRYADARRYLADSVRRQRHGFLRSV